jgi:hypothetical protein
VGDAGATERKWQWPNGYEIERTVLAYPYLRDTIEMIERLNRMVLRRKVDWSLQSSLWMMTPKPTAPTS